VSYPGDGLPRFKVGELEWVHWHGGRNLDAYVYDRAFCCTVVGAFHSTSLNSRWSRAERIEATRRRAIGLAAMLEAEHAVR
jgi:hypothetical protein